MGLLLVAPVTCSGLTGLFLTLHLQTHIYTYSRTCDTPALAWWAFFWSPQLPVAREYLSPSVMMRVLMASSMLKSLPRSMNFWAYIRTSFIRLRNSLSWDRRIKQLSKSTHSNATNITHLRQQWALILSDSEISISTSADKKCTTRYMRTNIVGGGLCFFFFGGGGGEEETRTWDWPSKQEGQQWASQVKALVAIVISVVHFPAPKSSQQQTMHHVPEIYTPHDYQHENCCLKQRGSKQSRMVGWVTNAGWT